MTIPTECPACGSEIYSRFGTPDNPVALNFACGAVWMPAVKWHVTCPEAFRVLCDLYRHNNQLWQEVINWRPE